MRVVVVGGAGFIGSAVCRLLVGERGASVLNLDKLTATSSLASLTDIASSPRYAFRRADVSDGARVGALLHAFEPDAIVHAAQERCRSGLQDETAAAMEADVLGTWRLLEAARAYWSSLAPERQSRFRLVSLSWSEAATAPVPAGRAAADALVAAWHGSFGLPTIVARAPATLGAYQFPDAPVPAAVIAHLDGGGTMPVSQEACEWLAVEDHARALAAMLEKGRPGAIYAIAGCGRMAPAGMAERARQLVGRIDGKRAPETASQAQRPEEVTRTSAPRGDFCSANLEHDTGWKAELSLDRAIGQTVRWYLDNQWWWRPLRAAQAADGDLGVLRIA